MKSTILQILIAFLHAIVSVFPSGSEAQNTAEFPDHGQKNNPVPPEMFQFLKHGGFPVSLYTGIPEISIPLYTIREGLIEIPLVLNYYAGGLRVSEEAGWVGLGWDLQLGSIVQITNDRDDFGEIPMNRPDYFHHSDPSIMLWTEEQMNYLHPVNVDYSPIPLWRFKGVYMPKNGLMYDFSTLLNYGGAEEETEPDIFKASFFGHYLEFMKDPNSEDIVCLNKKSYIIRKISVQDDFGWEIISPEGFHYFFEEITEINKPRIDWVSSPMIYSSFPSNTGFGLSDLAGQSVFGNGNVDNPVVDPSFKSRIWRISKIKDYYGDSVMFTYNQQKLPKFDFVSDFTWRVFKTSRDQEIITTCNDCGPISIGNTLYGRPAVSQPTIFYGQNLIEYVAVTTGSYLKEIVFTNGKVAFNTSEREDYFNSKKLDSITISNDTLVINSIKFNYEYFVSEYLGYGSLIPFKSYNELTKRLKLLAVQSKGEPPYSFQYNSTALPPKNSSATDFWGFNNGMIYNNAKVPNLLRFKVFDPVFHQPMQKNTSNHSSDSIFSKACMLEQITYPTSGKTIFEYELNSFDNQYNGYIVPNIDFVPDLINPNSNSLTRGSGLRIKSQMHMDEINPEKKTIYTYEGGKTQIPSLFIYNFTDFIYNHNLQSGTLERYAFENYETSQSNCFLPGLLGSDNRVGYDKVTISEVHEGGANNGKIEKYFVNAPDIVQSFSSLQFMKLPSNHANYQNGFLTEEKYYRNSENNSAELILQKQYTYSNFQVINPHYGLKHTLWGTFGYWDYGSGNLINTTRSDILGYYPIYTTSTNLTTIKTIEYFDNMTKSVVKTENFSFYSNSLLLNTKTEMLSSGEIQTLKYFYPDQALIIDELSTSEKNAVSMLLNPGINRPTEIIRQSEFVDDIILNENIRGFMQYDNLLVPSSIKFQVKNQELIEKIIFNHYDIRGNLLEFTKKDDFPVTCLWGYNYSSMIAEIQNATLTQVLSALNLSISDLQNQSDEALRTIFSELREEMPNSRITSYTYKPLVGMTSKTDPGGLTTFYFYDAMNRLETIKRDNGRIVKHFEYHFTESQ